MNLFKGVLISHPGLSEQKAVILKHALDRLEADGAASKPGSPPALHAEHVPVAACVQVHRAPPENRQTQ